MSEEALNDASKVPASPAAEAPPAAALCDTSNVAPTTQMTASSNPPCESSKWCCEMCTYENFPLSRKCTMCLSPRPAPDAAQALPVTGADAAAGAEAVAERLRPLRLASPAPGPAHAPPPKWACPTCTYENWPKALKCAMCGCSGGGGGGGVGAGTGGAGAGAEGGEAGRRGRVRAVGAGAGVTAAAGAGEALWLAACRGVVEGEARAVDAFLARGGDPARPLTPRDIAHLGRDSAFDVGHTLVHLAIRFQRQEILTTLLSRISGGGSGLKRSPSYIGPEVAGAIRRQLAGSVRSRVGSFPCRYLADSCTFSLPAEIDELPASIREQLFEELLDVEAQRDLEAAPPAINWSTKGSRLYALWNRSAGDCLPDAVSQALCGVSDRHNTLRALAADTLALARRGLFARWAAWERAQAARLAYAPTEPQLRAEWARLAAAAAAPHAPLHQLHVFVLAHVVRRPILVYGVDLVHSFRGEPLGYARFQGVYLPLLWEAEACSARPLALGYTRGHFSALVATDRRAPRPHYICREDEEGEDEIYLPLTDCEGKLLPVHFLNSDEMEDAEGVVRRWLGVRPGAPLWARQRAQRPLLQAQLLDNWLNHYRRLAQQTRACCDDADTDDD